MKGAGAKLIGVGGQLAFCSAFALLDGGASLALSSLLGAAANEDVRKSVGSLAAGATSYVGSWWINRSASRAEDRLRCKLPEPELLVENEHLYKLLDLALQTSISSAVGSEGFKSHSDDLERLVVAADDFFRDGARDDKPEVLDEFRAQEFEAFHDAARELDKGRAVEIVTGLAERVEADVSPRLLSRLAMHLQHAFPQTINGILVRDFAGGTPLAGQGFAALWLQFSRKQAEDMGDLKDAVAQLGIDLSRYVLASERAFDRRLAEVRAETVSRDSKLGTWTREWGKLLDAGQRETVQALSGISERIAVLEKSTSVLTLGSVQSLASFERGTMFALRQASFLGPLMEERVVQNMIAGDLVARDEELQQVDTLLHSKSEQVLYWKAMPGAGKTRLCIEAARVARRRGFIPLFVKEGGRDIIQGIHGNLMQLRGETPAGPRRILLIWDTSARSVDSESTRTILKLWRDGDVRGENDEIKVIVVSWPNQARAIEQEFSDPSNASWFVRRDLAPCGEREAFVELMHSLLPDRAREDVSALARAAEGNVLACLTGVIELRNGADLAELHSRESILSSRYNGLLRKTFQDSRFEQRHYAALWVVAGLGSVDSQRIEGAHSGRDDSSQFAQGLDDLVREGLVGRADDGAFFMAPDIFRVNLTRLALSDGLAFPKAGLERWENALRPWLDDEAMDPLLSVTQLAVGTAEERSEVERFLFNCLGEDAELTSAEALVRARTWAKTAMAAGTPEAETKIRSRTEKLLTHIGSPEIALVLAGMLLGATTGAEDLGKREELADRIAKLLERKEWATPEIALELATALYNGTVGQWDAEKCVELADRIEKMLERKEWATPQIAHRLAQALYHGTVGQPDAEKCVELADRIARLLERKEWATPEMALLLAQALCNGAVLQSDAKKRVEIANRIEKLLERNEWATPEIALKLAQALRSGAMAQLDAEKRVELADRIEKLLERKEWATPEIALELAKALYNGTVGQSDAEKCVELANRIEKLLERKEWATGEIALELAKALYNGTVGQSDLEMCVNHANRIARLLKRKEWATPEIALELAKALISGTVAQRDAEKRVEQANRIAELLERKEWATAEIALQLAKALYNGTVGQSDAEKCVELANRIARLLERKEWATPEIALELAKALISGTVAQRDAEKRVEQANRIARLLECDEWATPEIALLLAKALFNGTVGQSDAEKCVELANRIEKLMERKEWATPEIARELAQALVNGMAVQRDEEKRIELTSRIAGLLERREWATPEIALLLAKALFNGTVEQRDPEKRSGQLFKVTQVSGRFPADLPIETMRRLTAIQADRGEPTTQSELEALDLVVQRGPEELEAVLKLVQLCLEDFDETLPWARPVHAAYRRWTQ